MTILIIGGAYQGKMQYSATKLGLKAEDFIDGEKISAEEYTAAKYILNLHLFIRKLLKQGQSMEEITRLVCENIKGKAVICDDICGGIIPIDAFENEYREAVGRTLCEAVKSADVVIRVQCGLGQVLKGRL